MRRLTIGGLMVAIVLVALGLAALTDASEFTAAAAFLATCGVLGVAVLGALFATAGKRAMWAGVAVFGWGYMALAFTPTLGSDPALNRTSRRPRLLTTLILERLFLFGRGAHPAGDAAPATQKLRVALDRPVTMPFENETPLVDVIKYVRNATSTGPGDPGVPIWIDPKALEEQGKTMDSPVVFNVEGVPLRTSLDLILRQLGLTYVVKGGLLRIISTGGALPVDDYTFFQRIGHCLFALLAALLGGLAASLVARRRRDESAA